MVVQSFYRVVIRMVVALRPIVSDREKFFFPVRSSLTQQLGPIIFYIPIASLLQCYVSALSRQENAMTQSCERGASLFPRIRVDPRGRGWEAILKTLDG